MQNSVEVCLYLNSQVKIRISFHYIGKYLNFFNNLLQYEIKYSKICHLLLKWFNNLSKLTLFFVYLLDMLICMI